MCVCCGVRALTVCVCVRRYNSFSCNQHLQKAAKSDEVTQMFQMTGVVRAFVPIDREALKAKAIAFEKKAGVKVSIQETDADPS